MSKKHTIKKNELKWYYFLPLILIIAVVPLITFAKVITIEGAELQNWKGGSTHVDFFSYWKSVWLQIFTYISLALYLILLKLNKLPFKKEKKYYIPMIIYAVFVILSSVMSENQIVAMRGFIELFQGMWVLLCYIIITFLTINFVNSERDVKILLYAFIFLAVAIGILGIGQYFGFDLFKSLFGRKLILPKELYPSLLDSLKFTFGKYTIYATLYNTNFVGSFGAMLFPISLALFLFAKKNKTKILTGIFSFIIFFTWLGCNSRAGYVGFFAAFVIGALVFRKEIIKNIKPLALLLIVFIITAIGMNSVSNGRVSGQFSKLSIKKESERLENISEQKPRFKEIKADGFDFIVETENEKFVTTLQDNEISFKDENNKQLEVENEENIFTFSDERYKNYKIVIEDSLITCLVYGVDIKVYMSNEGFDILSTGGTLAETGYPPYIKLFEGKEKFASNRGYIWSRSIPMLKDTLILGHGPGNYCIYFPQNDFVGKAIGLNDIRMIVDKPHNMYLQIGINTGVISLIALIALFLIYFIDSMKLYVKYNYKTLEDYLGAGILTAIIGYLAAGMFNDHIISVSPIFWALIGLGISINLRLKTKISKQN